MPSTIGIDIGTSSIKVGLLDLDTLRLEGLASTALDQTLDLPSEVLWQQTRRALQAALDRAGHPETVAAIGVAGQMHGAVLYDQHGQVIDPIITWKDQARCSPQILELIHTAVARRGDQDLGTAMASGYTGTILLWLKQQHPDLFRKIARFSLIADFIRGRLLGAGDGCTDPTDAFGTGLFNVRQSRWQAGLIEELGLPLEIFPEVRSSFARAGCLSTTLAREWGLAEIPIIYGGGDNQVGMLGSGLSSAGSPVLLNIGTAAQISKIIPAYQSVPGMDTRSFFHDQVALVGASLSGGRSYRWLRAAIQSEQDRAISYAELDHLAAQAPPGADGLLFCTGPTRRSPNRQPGFRGNLARAHDPGCQARAVMEGVLMDLYAHYASLEKLDRCDWITGGGKGLQGSPIWPQIAADLFGKPLRVTQAENVVLGAATLAAFGTGHLPTLDAAFETEPYKELHPDPQRSDFYQREFSIYYRSQIS